MPKIKFTHVYEKILDQHNDAIESATLLDVVPINLKNLSPEFMAYDTNDGLFKLPNKGFYLMLIFQKPKECEGVCSTDIFTTLRRCAPGKESYYRKNIGKCFEVEIIAPSVAQAV